MKRMDTIILLAGFLLSSLPGMSSGQGFIAVMPLDANGISETEAAVLTDRLRSELFQTGEFEVIEREKMRAILEEQNFQLTGCSSNECMVEVGQLIGVQQMVGGSVSQFGRLFSISIRLIDVETGRIIGTAIYDHNGEIEGLLDIGTRQVARQLTAPDDQAGDSETKLVASTRQEPESSITQAQHQPDRRLESRKESWYTYWSVGGAGFGYPDRLQQAIEWAESQTGVSRSRYSVDLLGFYWHIAPRTVLGFIIKASADQLGYQDQTLLISQFTYSASSLHYLDGQFGRGLFLRGDLGIAEIKVEDSTGEEARSNSGLGVLLGTGWSFRLGSTSILLGTNMALRFIEENTYSVIDFSLGGLF